MKLGFKVIGVVVVFLILGAWWMFANSPDALNQQLMRAIQEKQSAAQLEALLARGANPNHIYSASLGPGLGTTLLTIACAQANDVAIDVLLKHGANPNLEGSDALPLWIAVQSKNLSLVRRLLDHGADPNLKLSEYYDNMTPLQLAEESNNPALIALLKKASPPK